jgi:hypothetical protein
MKANELRIGNWIMAFPITFPQQVIDVMCDSVNTENGQGMHYGDVDPIPLTEEWLLKFGFEKPKEEHRYNTWEKYIAPNRTFNILPPYEKKKYYGYSANHRIGELEIKYVHQMQNLYFALTGEELRIKG